jgi:AcrR family transcriptional regulator
MKKPDVAPPASVAGPAPRRYRGVEASERVAERRQQFVEAGLECFGTRGYHAVTVRELCAQAQLTERYFYESFKDREALFAAVYESLIAAMRGDFLAATLPKAPDLDSMARAGLTAFYRGLQKDPRAARVLMVEVLTVSPSMERRAQQAMFGFGDLLKQMVLGTKPAGTRSSRAAGAELDLLAAGLIGACVNIAMRWIADGYDQPARTVIDTAMTFFDTTLRLLADKPVARR